MKRGESMEEGELETIRARREAVLEAVRELTRGGQAVPEVLHTPGRALLRWEGVVLCEFPYGEGAASERQQRARARALRRMLLCLRPAATRSGSGSG